MVVSVFIVFVGSSLLLAQSKLVKLDKEKYALEPLGIISPNPKIKAVFPMGAVTAKEFKRKYGVVKMMGGVDFVKAKSWELYSAMAKASSDDLSRVVADLPLAAGRR